MDKRKKKTRKRKLTNSCFVADESDSQSESEYCESASQSSDSSSVTSDSSSHSPSVPHTDSESDGIIKRKKNCWKKRPKKVFQIRSDSEDEDYNCGKRLVIRKDYSLDLDGLEVIEELPIGTTTKHTHWKRKIKDYINESEGSNTHTSDNSGLDKIMSDEDMDVISTTTTLSSLMNYIMTDPSVQSPVLSEQSTTPDICKSPDLLKTADAVEKVQKQVLPQKPLPPEPQLPTTRLPFINIKTPDLETKELTVWKNGQAIKIPAPPKLPDSLRFSINDAMDTIDEIKRRLNNSTDEIEALEEETSVSLMCPISNKRVVIPSRSKNCHHIDCFDINAFLEINYNKKIVDWKCPKCKLPARTEDLIIDNLVMHILNHKSVDPSVESIKFDRNAVWVPDMKITEIYSNKNNDSNVININDFGDDIIELDDDDDDEEPAPQPKSANPSNTAKPFPPNVSQTSSTVISSEQNLLNMIPTNHNQRGGKSGDPYYDRILLFLKSTEQEITNGQRPSRWSATKAKNPPPINIIRPPQNITLGQAMRMNSQLRSAQPSQHKTQPQSKQTTSRASPQFAGTTILINNVPRVPPPVAHTSTPAPVNLPPNKAKPTNKCNFKFTYDNNNILTVFCPLCNESFPNEPNGNETAVNHHSNTAKHRELESRTSNKTTFIRTQPQKPVQQTVGHNNVAPMRPNQQPVQPFQPPIRAYGNTGFQYPSNNANWSGYAPQPTTATYDSNYSQYTFPPQSSITNNFYAPNPTYIQQLSPQTHPNQTNPILYNNNQLNPNYPYPGNANPNNNYYYPS